ADLLEVEKRAVNVRPDELEIRGGVGAELGGGEAGEFGSKALQLCRAGFDAGPGIVLEPVVVLVQSRRGPLGGGKGEVHLVEESIGEISKVGITVRGPRRGLRWRGSERDRQRAWRGVVLLTPFATTIQP